MSMATPIFKFEEKENHVILARVENKNEDDIKIIIGPPSYNGKPVKEVGHDCFNYLVTVETVFLPEGIEIVREGAFYCSECSIVLHDNVFSIEAYALYGCRLQDFRVPDGLRRIGRSAFNSSCIESFDAQNIKTIEKIEKWAFAGCKYLQKASVPEECLIEDEAFADCELLGEFKLPKKFGNNVLWGSPASSDWYLYLAYRDGEEEYGEEYEEEYEEYEEEEYNIPQPRTKRAYKRRCFQKKRNHA